MERSSIQIDLNKTVGLKHKCGNVLVRFFKYEGSAYIFCPGCRVSYEITLPIEYAFKDWDFESHKTPT